MQYYVGIELHITLYGRTKKKFVNSEHSSAVCQNSGQNKYVIKTLENKPLFVIMYTYLQCSFPQICNFLEILLRIIKLMFYVYQIQICFFCDFAPECTLYVSSRLFLMMLLLSKTVRDEIIIIVSIDLSRLILFRVFELCFIYKTTIQFQDTLGLIQSKKRKMSDRFF